MRTLRVLTGAHAGARLRLARERYLLAGTADADIVITDWNTAALRLEMPAEGPVQATEADAPQGTAARTLEDMQPLRFGDIALCIGPEDATWPSDLQLLETLMTRRELAEPSPPSPQPAPTRSRLWAMPPHRLAMAGGGAAMLMLVAFTGLVSGNGKAAVPNVPLKVAVAHAVQSAGATGVTVHTAADGSVSVDGMVPEAADALRLRTALAPFEHVAHRYTAGTSVAQQIEDALGNPGLAVRYKGDGEFLVSGNSLDLEGMRSKLKRIATDIGPAVTRIELQVKELQPPPVLPTNALMSSDTVRYVQTRDGTKHLVIGVVPPTIDVVR